MTEHVHEWKAAYQGHDIAQWCDYYCACGETIEGQDIVVRLNATGRLSAEWAREMARCVSKDCPPRCECADNLTAYADTLERK